MVATIALGPPPVEITATASPGRLWANGHCVSSVTVSATGPAGPLVADAVTLAPPEGSGVSVTPLGSGTSLTSPAGGACPTLATGHPGLPGKSATAITDASGHARFAVSTTTLGALTLHATDAKSGGSASGTVTGVTHKLVVQFLGVNTSLSCSSGNCSSPDDGFAEAGGLDPALANQGFASSDLLFYSYNGGSVTPAGTWQASSYACSQTGQDYRTDMTDLTNLVDSVARANPNTVLYLVGHSQGGLVAFQELGFLKGLAASSHNVRIGGIFTMDSPLGGIPPEEASFATQASAAGLVCWNGPAPGELGALYGTTTDHAHQATTSLMACELFDPTACDFPIQARVTNDTAALGAEKAGIDVATYGNHNDGLYDPSQCWSALRLFLPDNSSTQIVSGASGGLYPYGGNSPQGATSLGACVAHSHHQVYRSAAPAVAGAIGGQIS
ncbi:MAG: alpha/beta fold hydrolase domain-containing protein [Acidimicrobiales bacterium]